MFQAGIASLFDSLKLYDATYHALCFRQASHLCSTLKLYDATYHALCFRPASHLCSTLSSCTTPRTTLSVSGRHRISVRLSSCTTPRTTLSVSGRHRISVRLSQVVRRHVPRSLFQAGIASLFDSLKLYDATYHALCFRQASHLCSTLSSCTTPRTTLSVSGRHRVSVRLSQVVRRHIPFSLFQAGIASLFNSLKLYDATYHSLCFRPASRLCSTLSSCTTPRTTLSVSGRHRVSVQLSQVVRRHVPRSLFQAGIASLFNSLKLYDATYHSLGVHFRPICRVSLGPTNRQTLLFSRRNNATVIILAIVALLI